MEHLTDFLHSKVIVLPTISIPINVTDFNSLTNLHMQSTV